MTFKITMKQRHGTIRSSYFENFGHVVGEIVEDRDVCVCVGGGGGKINRFNCAATHTIMINESGGKMMMNIYESL